MDTKNRTERERFIRKLAVIAEIYGKSLTKMTIEAYMEAMSSFPIDRIEKAMDIVIRERVSGLYFPAPGDIIEVLKSLPVTEDEKRRQIGYKEFVPNQEQRKWLNIQERYIWYGITMHTKTGVLPSRAGMRQFAIEKYKVDPDWFDKIAAQIPESDA